MYLNKDMMEMVDRQFRADCNLGMDGKSEEGGGYWLGRTPGPGNRAEALEGAEYERYLRKKMGEAGMKCGYGPGIETRIYGGMDYMFRAILFMGRGYLMADRRMYAFCKEIYLKSGCVKPEWFCQFDNLRVLDEELSQFGRQIADTHVYFLPAADGEKADVLPDLRWFEGKELETFRGDGRFRHAVCFAAKMPDMLAVAAMDENRVMAVAGCSADSALLWQIGVDVDPAYGGRGLAVKLVSLLKEEILRRGKIPFYGTSESHAVSRMVAVKAGFLPAWSEVFVKRDISGNSLDESELLHTILEI